MNKAKNKKVFLIGDIGMGKDGFFHVGDEAMWYTNANYYLQRGWEVTATSRDKNDSYKTVTFFPDTYIKNYDDFSKRIRNTHIDYQRFEQTIKDVDLIHISGGGNMNNLWPGHFFYRCFIAHICKQKKRKLIATSQTLGPIDNEQEKLFATYVKTFTYFGVRDSHLSLKLLQKLGFRGEQIGIDADDALEKFSINNHPTKKPRYFISLHRNIGSHKICQKWKKIGVICNQPQVISNNSYESDNLVSTLCAPLPKRKSRESLISWSTYSIGSCWGGISSRYHPVVFALMQGVPVLAVAINKYYVNKFKGIYEYCNLPYEKYIFKPGNIPNTKNVVNLLHTQKKSLDIISLNKKLEADRKRLYEIINN